MSRQDSVTQAKKSAFLAAFVQLGTVLHAAEAAGIERKSHYRWLADPIYAAAFAEAEDKAREAMVREARRRAIEGTEKPVYQGGKLVGTIREYSDTLLIFLMKGAMPETYRERVDINMDIRTAIERLTSDPVEQAAAVAEAERLLAARR